MTNGQTRVYSDSDKAYLELKGEDALERAKRILNDIPAPQDSQYVRIVIEQDDVGDATLSELLTSNGDLMEEEEDISLDEDIDFDPTDSQRDTVLRTMLRKQEQFWHTDEVRDHLPDGSNIPDTAVSKRLYSLAEAGFIDKQDSERDYRMKKYKLTSKGVERAEEVEGVDSKDTTHKAHTEV